MEGTQGKRSMDKKKQGVEESEEKGEKTMTAERGAWSEGPGSATKRAPFK